MDPEINRAVDELADRVCPVEPIPPERVYYLLVSIVTTGAMVEICLRRPTPESGDSAACFVRAGVGAARLLGLYSE
jgi:hypothetical protein